MSTYKGYPKDTVPHHLRCGHTIAEMRPLFCVKCTVIEAENRYGALNQAYRDGNPLVSDLEFDKYETYCRARWPECKTFHKVGKDMGELDGFWELA